MKWDLFLPHSTAHFALTFLRAAQTFWWWLLNGPWCHFFLITVSLVHQGSINWKFHFNGTGSYRFLQMKIHRVHKAVRDQHRLSRGTSWASCSGPHLGVHIKFVTGSWIWQLPTWNYLKETPALQCFCSVPGEAGRVYDPTHGRSVPWGLVYLFTESRSEQILVDWAALFPWTVLRKEVGEKRWFLTAWLCQKKKKIPHLFRLSILKVENCYRQEKKFRSTKMTLKLRWKQGIRK